ncbi:PAS domain S-box protein [Mucilaginibacter terrae]|uniref:histidine kinase n=1 Tax=Mucilaginibacter terrae TaxID=1955052 RepID=A0ABU3GY61_9SPHI|nr:PAS domain S-box protein [Mucilaginibacter terrae]MDT3404694.1 PAS domain S-box-containing protein [Mucilaginibacter terrae]
MNHAPTDVAVFSAIIEESPTPIALYEGREMRIRLANKAMICDAWGKDGSVIGKTLKEALPELEGQPFFQLLEDVFTTGKPYEAEEDLVQMIIDGQLQDNYYSFTYKPLFNAEGKVWAILNTATNVTGQVTARKHAHEIKEQLNFSLAAAGIGTWYLNLDTNKVSWDERTKELYGFPKDDVVVYEEALKYIHPNDRLLVDAAVTRALNHESGGNYDIKFRTIGAVDKKLRWLHCKGKAYFNTNGQPYRFSGITLDISEQVFADEKIKSAEQLAQLALENIDAGSYLVHLATNAISYTPLFAKILTGNEAVDLNREAFIKYVHPEDLKVRKAAYEKALRTGKLSYEARVVWDDGSVHWIKVTGRYTYDNTKKPTHFSGIVEDITADAEAKLEQQRLLWLIDNSTDLIALSNWDGKLTYLNKAGQKMMGFDSLQEAQRPTVEYVMPDQVKRVAEEINPSLLKHGRWEGEVIYRNHKTGEAIPGYATSLLVRDVASGEPLGRASVVRDLRPEIAARKALIESEQLFRAITTASPTALWMTDNSGEITYVNQVWVNWTGRPLDEHLGSGWLNSVLPDDVQVAADKFINDFKAQVVHESFFRITHLNGKIRWVVCTGNPQYNAEGIFKGYVGACVDITDQKQLQQQKDEFIGIASHELKTPVTSLKAYTQVLQTIFMREGDEKSAMLGKMNNQIDRLTSLIGDLLDVTKIQSGRLQFNDDYFDFNQLITELVEDLQRTTSKHQIALELNTTGTAYADKDRIVQVITNLISNAIKYSPQADKIIVRTSLKNNEINVCVQDFGIGIKEDKQHKVFEQFYRVSGDKQHTFPGLGLGLYISSEIIKREGGRIWVTSVEGQGSTFCFALPVNHP